jgi:hypothetical protein
MNIQQRIAQIIRQSDGDHTMGAAALAEVLVSELGLAEEWGARAPEGYGPWTIYPSREGVEQNARRADRIHVRYVTEWVADE